VVKEIFDGISVAICKEFGDGYAVYGDSDVEQGVNTPCFFIVSLSINKKRLGKRRFRATYSFDVHYMPDSDTEHLEMQEASEGLLDCLECITLLDGDMVRGRGLRTQPVDGVLHCFVDYTVFLQDASRAPEMEHLTVRPTTTN